MKGTKRGKQETSVKLSTIFFLKGKTASVLATVWVGKSPVPAQLPVPSFTPSLHSLSSELASAQL